jgi:hypothetical protein
MKPFFYIKSLWKCAAHWWGSRTSNPVWGAKPVPGGFDSHALPPFFNTDKLTPRSLNNEAEYVKK